MTARVTDLFEVPEHVRKTDFVVKLSEGVEHPEETAAIISAGAKITLDEARLAVGRLDFTHPAITKADYDKIGAFGDLLKKVGDIPTSADVKGLLDQLLDPEPYQHAVGAKG